MKIRFMSQFLRAWLVVFMFIMVVPSAGSAAVAPVVKEIPSPKTILFVGNSFTYYNNSLHAHVGRLIREADKERAKDYFLRAMTISGGYLADHQYGFAGTANSRKWDVIVIQGQSNEPIEEAKTKDFIKYAEQFIAAAREAKAEPVLFITWAYEGKPEMTAALRDAYTTLANRTKTLAVPVGPAFASALEKKPGLVLHETDKRHPSLAGTYLAACTFYGALMKKSPVGMRYDAGLGEETAKFLQGVAWDTVKDFYSWK